MAQPKGTVRRTTIQALRDQYRAQWNRDWPYEDEYLAELWREVQDRNEKGNSRIALPKRYEDCLMLMRECHRFQPADEGFPQREH